MATISDGLRIAADLAFLLRSQRWPRARILDYQERRLVEQLRYAVRQVPWYRALGIDAASIDSAAALERFPVIDKTIVQVEHARLRSPALDPARLQRSVTSGSSGRPTTTWFDRRSWLLTKYALKIRRTLLAGAPWRQRLMIFDESAAADGGCPAPVRFRLLRFRQTRLSVFTPIEDQYAELMALAPTAIYGSPSGVREICDHALREGLPLPAVPVIFLASELIADGVRRRISEQFGATVIGVYGSTEFKEVAHECPHGRYHVNFESVFVECIEDGDDPPRLLLTSLVNRAMPLIRFDIGDYATLKHDDCPCGRASPYLTGIVGREAEFLELADGRRLSPYRLTTAVETTPGLMQYQFVQGPGRKLRLEAVLSGAPDAAERSLGTLRQCLRRVLGPGVEVAVIRVAAIERTRAGKQQVVRRAAAHD